MGRISRAAAEYHVIPVLMMTATGVVISMWWLARDIRIPTNSISNLLIPADNPLIGGTSNDFNLPGLSMLDNAVQSAEVWVYRYVPVIAGWLLFVTLIVVLWATIYYRRATGGRSYWRDRRFRRPYRRLLEVFRLSVSDQHHLDTESINDLSTQQISGIPLGELPDGRCVYRPSRKKGSCLGIGAPGKGKTTGWLIPSVVRFGRKQDSTRDGAVLVFDLKGQSVRDTERVCSHDNRKIFNLSDPDHSCSFDPLRYARHCTSMDDLITELESIAETVVEKDPKEPAFFAEGGRDFVVAALLFGIFSDQWINFSEVAYEFTVCSWSDMIDLIKAGERKEPYERIKKYEDMDTKNISSCYGDAVKGMRIFADDRMLKLLSPAEDRPVEMSDCFGVADLADAVAQVAADSYDDRSSIKIEDLIAPPDRRCDIFIVIEPQYLRRYGALLALLVQQLGAEFLRLPDRPESEQVPILLCIDEFAQYARIPILPQLLSLGRSKGLSLMLLVQSFQQILSHYSRDEVESMLACIEYIGLFSVQGEDQEYFSRMLGNIRSLTTSTTAAIEGSERVSEGSTETTERFCPPEELADLESKGQLVVIANGKHAKLRVVKGWKLC